MKRRFWWGALASFATLSVILGVVGREAVSWRPQLLKTGTFEAYNLRTPSNTAEKSDISQDGKLCISWHEITPSSNSYRVAVREVKTKKLRSSFHVNASEPINVWFDCNDSLVIVQWLEATDWFIYDAQTGKYLWDCGGSKQFSPDNQLLVSISQETISVYDSHSGHLRQQITVPTQRANLTDNFMFVDNGNAIEIGDHHGNLWNVRIR